MERLLDGLMAGGSIDKVREWAHVTPKDLAAAMEDPVFAGRLAEASAIAEDLAKRSRDHK